VYWTGYVGNCFIRRQAALLIYGSRVRLKPDLRWVRRRASYSLDEGLISRFLGDGTELAALEPVEVAEAGIDSPPEQITRPHRAVVAESEPLL
jgi:hypothetical protein